MPQTQNQELYDPLAGNYQAEQDQARRLREEQQAARQAMMEEQALEEEAEPASLRQAVMQAKSKKSGRVGTKQARQTVSQVAHGQFIALIFAAMFLDLISFFDLGTFSSLINWFAIVIFAVANGVRLFFKKTRSRWDMAARRRGRAWGTLIKVAIPILEFFLGFLPGWTVLALVTYFRAKQYGMQAPRPQSVPEESYYEEGEYEYA